MDRAVLIERLTREPDVIAAWLFGSEARGEARPTSDVDVAILTTTPRTGTLADLRLDLAEELTRAIGRPVDLVVLERAPLDLVHRVLRDGELLVERDRSARIRFEVDARNRYFDMLPIWRTYRRGHALVRSLPILSKHLHTTRGTTAAARRRRPVRARTGAA